MALCDVCGGDGKIEYQVPGGWYEPNYETHECAECEGTGLMFIEGAEPIDIEDTKEEAHDENELCEADALPDALRAAQEAGVFRGLVHADVQEIP